MNLYKRLRNHICNLIFIILLLYLFQWFHSSPLCTLITSMHNHSNKNYNKKARHLPLPPFLTYPHTQLRRNPHRLSSSFLFLSLLFSTCHKKQQTQIVPASKVRDQISFRDAAFQKRRKQVNKT